MSQPQEFSLESVRQLMLAHGGRVTNHALVKSYRQWLTDPELKDQARAQFKVEPRYLQAVAHRLLAKGSGQISVHGEATDTGTCQYQLWLIDPMPFHRVIPQSCGRQQ